MAARQHRTNRSPQRGHSTAPRDPWGTWQERLAAGTPDGENGEVRTYVNQRYSAQVVRRNGLELLMVRHNGGAKEIPDRDIQRVKDEIVGTDREAIQIFPKRAEVFDQPGVAMLWVVAADDPLPYALSKLHRLPQAATPTEEVPAATQAAPEVPIAAVPDDDPDPQIERDDHDDDGDGDGDDGE